MDTNITIAGPKKKWWIAWCVYQSPLNIYNMEQASWLDVELSTCSLHSFIHWPRKCNIAATSTFRLTKKKKKKTFISPTLVSARLVECTLLPVRTIVVDRWDVLLWNKQWAYCISLSSCNAEQTSLSLLKDRLFILDRSRCIQRLANCFFFQWFCCSLHKDDLHCLQAV